MTREHSSSIRTEIPQRLIGRIARPLLAVLVALYSIADPVTARTTNASPTTHGPEGCFDRGIPVSLPSSKGCPPGTEMRHLAAGLETERLLQQFGPESTGVSYDAASTESERRPSITIFVDFTDIR